MISREQKEKIVEEIAKKIKESKAIIFTDYRGISVEEMTGFRKDLKERGIEFRVMKQTLFALAVKKAGADIDMSGLKNHPVAIAFSMDEVEPAKAVHEFNKKTEKLVMLGGALDGKTVSLTELESLALMPGREEMYVRVVSSLASPLRGLMSVISGNLRGLINVLSEYEKQRSK